MTFRFKKFKVYQDAKAYCKLGREVIEKYIRKKDRELAFQIGKALHSIVLNIAEGSGDNSDIEFARFLGISIRSVSETVAGFDLGLLYGMIPSELNDRLEGDGEQLVGQLSAFRNSLRKLR